MILPTIIAPLVTGCILGLVYGYSFVLQQRSIFFKNNSRIPLKSFLFFPLRIIFFILIWYYLLRSPVLHSILMMSVCMVIFWLVILNKKTQLYEQRTTSRNDRSMVTWIMAWIRSSTAGTK